MSLDLLDMLPHKLSEAEALAESMSDEEIVMDFEYAIAALNQCSEGCMCKSAQEALIRLYKTHQVLRSKLCPEMIHPGQEEVDAAIEDMRDQIIMQMVPDSPEGIYKFD